MYSLSTYPMKMNNASSRHNKNKFGAHIKCAPNYHILLTDVLRHVASSYTAAWSTNNLSSMNYLIVYKHTSHHKSYENFFLFIYIFLSTVHMHNNQLYVV